jgi:aspartate aminotransferase
LAALGQALLKQDHVLVVADDIYERLIYYGLKFYNIARVVPELKGRTIVVNGVSKTYAMTDWRIGWTM